MKSLLDIAKADTPVKTHCQGCKDPFEEGFNIFSEQGRAEKDISGLCEVCFDNAFAEKDFSVLDTGVVNLVKSTDGLVLAGGALRSVIDPYEPIQDYDLFFLDTSQVGPVRDSLLEQGYSLVFTCPEGKLYSYKKESLKVQLILNRPYTDVEDILGSFDIEAACAAWDGESFIRYPRFVSSVLHKKIFLNTVEYPVATLGRFEKYILKGYSLTRQAREEFVGEVAGKEWDGESLRFYID